MSERLKSGVAQAPGGALLCAVEGCMWVAVAGDCLCVHHARTRDARTTAIHEIAVAAGFTAKRPEFAVHRLNAAGMERAAVIAQAFSLALDTLESVAGKDGRDMAIVRTKLDEACFFAKRALASKPENQEPAK